MFFNGKMIPCLLYQSPLTYSRVLYSVLNVPFFSKRFGLITFHLSTTPDFEWKVSTGWESEQHECSWYGISCSDNNTVSEISLPNNRLSGTLPHEIALAGIGEQLVYLDLSGNNIRGKLVPELGTFKSLGKCYKLTTISVLGLNALINTAAFLIAFLDLKANDFTGKIPPELGGLSKLGENIITLSQPIALFFHLTYYLLH